MMRQKVSKEYTAYRKHRDNATKRGIDFNFTFEEWLAWWMIDNRIANRGRSRDNFVMARKGDVGPYSADNVYCATAAQNLGDIPFSVRSDCMKRAHAAGLFGHHLRVRGVGHPKAQAVMTPAGSFGSAALAVEHFGLTRQYAARLAKAGHKGWSYTSNDAP